MKITFLILYSFLLLSTCQQQQVQYDNSVATTTVTETVDEDTSNIDDFCFNEDGFQSTELGLACNHGE